MTSGGTAKKPGGKKGWWFGVTVGIVLTIITVLQK
jgi:hypothetical protein